MTPLMIDLVVIGIHSMELKGSDWADCNSYINIEESIQWNWKLLAFSAWGYSLEPWESIQWNWKEQGSPPAREER